MDPIERQERIVAALHHSRCYPHDAEGVEVIETHISWVVLAGPYAYKLKKALDLGFLDYSTLERRYRFCEEELRLNRRTAPHLYLGIVAICGSVEQPEVGGTGPVIEWAVKMRRFEQQQLASQQLAMQRLTIHHIERLGSNIARFHQQADAASATSTLGEALAIYQPIEENFRQIREQLVNHPLLQQLPPLEEWYRHTEPQRVPLLRKRKAEGFIRECHGDLHLNNIVLLDEEPCPFDGIEFNDNLRYVDVVSDIAFLVMDLDYRGRSDLGWLLLDSYLQESGDYAGMALLRFYQIYRAMVRAKVAAIRSNQTGLSATAREELLAEVNDYLHLARRYTHPSEPRLLLLHGFSGSGKSSIARELLMAWGAIRLRSDVERKRLFGITAHQPSGSALGGGIYSADATQRTYAQLATLSTSVLECGFNVIVDATFLRQAERQRFAELAEAHALRWYLLDVTASEATLRERIMQRHTRQHDASEADLAVLAYQLTHHDPISEAEQPHLLVVDTDRAWSIVPLLPSLQQGDKRQPAQR